MVHPSRDGRFKDCRLARMSSGHYCLIRDLGLVKGGKGLRHHEVALELTWRGLFLMLKSVTRVRWTDDASSVKATASAGVRRVVRILRGTTLRT
jgi:hypothetical protein